jgi:hypothetical protein
MKIEYEKRPHYLVAKVTGQWTDANSIALVDHIKAEAEKTDSKKILLNLMGLSHPESNLIRHNAGKKIAETLSSYRLSGFSQPEKINHLAEITATNRGANFKMFTSEFDATQWLLRDD